MIQLARFSAALCVVAVMLAGCNSSAKMSFFVTSVPAGDGGNFGGLAGADAHCQKLATASDEGEPPSRARFRSVGPRE